MLYDYKKKWKYASKTNFALSIFFSLKIYFSLQVIGEYFMYYVIPYCTFYLSIIYSSSLMDFEWRLWLDLQHAEVNC